jgi:hypothetical protein
LVLREGAYGLVLVKIVDFSKDMLSDDSKAIEAMEDCTIASVFEEGKRFEEDFPVVRILLNLQSCAKRRTNGAKVICDDYDSPFLLIQSDCSDIKVLENEEVRWFFVRAVTIAESSCVGRMSKYEASRREPPFDFSDDDEEPFNPAYNGVLNDNDWEVFGSELFNMNRPKFNLKKHFK